MCGDPNSVLRFAFIEFTDEGNISISNHISVCLLCVMNLLFIGWQTSMFQRVQGLLWICQELCLDIILSGFCHQRLPLHQSTQHSYPGYATFRNQHACLKFMAQGSCLYLVWSLKKFAIFLWSAVWWWTGNVCKDYLLHKHWQEGLLPTLMLPLGIHFVIILF